MQELAYIGVYRHEIATVRTVLESAGFAVWIEAVREPDDGERARQAYLIVQAR